MFGRLKNQICVRRIQKNIDRGRVYKRIFSKKYLTKVSEKIKDFESFKRTARILRRIDIYGYYIMHENIERSIILMQYYQNNIDDFFILEKTIYRIFKECRDSGEATTEDIREVLLGERNDERLSKVQREMQKELFEDQIDLTQQIITYLIEKVKRAEMEKSNGIRKTIL